MGHNRVFDAGNMNDKGICYAIVCDWIVKCKAGVNVASRYDFSSSWDNQNRWVAGDRLQPGGDGIDTQYGLVPVGSIWNRNPPVSLQWIATEMTKGMGFFLFSVWGQTLDITQGRYTGNGHAMGTRKGMGKMQFLDPNYGIEEFDNSRDFYDWLPNYLIRYQNLLTQQVQIKKF